MNMIINNREIKIVRVSGSEDDMFVYANYSDNDEPLDSAAIEELLDVYAMELYEIWYQTKVSASEDLYEE